MQANTSTRPAGSTDADWCAQLREQMPSLSRQLQRVGQYVLDHADHIAAERIQDVARQCDVQPSAIVRFAKALGFKGFIELKQAFAGNTPWRPRHDYRALLGPPPARTTTTWGTGADIALHWLDSAMLALHAMRSSIEGEQLRDAVDILSRCPRVWLLGDHLAGAITGCTSSAGVGRNIPTARERQSGLATLKRVRDMRAGDSLVAISTPTGIDTTPSVVRFARQVGCSVIAIAASDRDPIAAQASVCLHVPACEQAGYPSLVHALTLIHAMLAAANRAAGAVRPCPAGGRVPNGPAASSARRRVNRRHPVA